MLILAALVIMAVIGVLICCSDEPHARPIFLTGAELRLLFRDATARQRLWLAFLVSAMFGLATATCSWTGSMFAKLTPTTRTVAVVTRHIQRTERLVVPVPPRVSFPSLKDPKEACSGAPAIINKLVVTEPTNEKSSWETWFTLRPAGDDYLVYCHKSGATGDMWKEGDLIRLYGEPA